MPTTTSAPVPAATLDRSYRALLSVPALGRVLVGMQISRIAQSMVGLAVVLFTLDVYGSAAVSGLVAAAATLPGIVASPVAGALLDRHGRTRLVILDYLVAAASLVLTAALSLAGLLPVWLLVLIAAVSSLTGPLSTTGLRSLFPVMVPHHLWERANAADSTGYVLASLIGAPAAGLLFQVAGPQGALVGIAMVFVVAAIVLVRIPDPRTDVVSTGRLWLDAWQGLRYTWGNRTLRALGFSISSLNLAWGVLGIVLPVIVLRRIESGPLMVGLLFAIQAVGGVAAAFAFGRIDSRGRERRMLALPMLGSGLLFLLLVPSAGLLPLAVCMAATGILNGPIDIALFTLRQRRTDPAWMGRAFAVSMAFNSLGGPIGSAIAGLLATGSPEAAVLVASLACGISAVLAQAMIPNDDSVPASVGASTLAGE